MYLFVSLNTFLGLGMCTKNKISVSKMIFCGSPKIIIKTSLFIEETTIAGDFVPAFSPTIFTVVSCKTVKC